MNTILIKWFHRVIELFKVYLTASLIAVVLILAYGFITGPISRMLSNEQFMAFVSLLGFVFLGAIAVIVVFFVVRKILRVKGRV